MQSILTCRNFLIPTIVVALMLDGSKRELQVDTVNSGRMGLSIATSHDGFGLFPVPLAICI